MRAGVCAVPQALTVEAAGLVKQAINLARRRGNAQVTPLHVASAMLACPTGLLRRACNLHSHSHPLQCKALELCFNVALNRLPSSTSSPFLLGGGPQHSPRPSLSNALVAALKRAQAHQRRVSIENEQQPILALKIEVDQLVVSILDDPSVSRVMREAGFSSSQVKGKVAESFPPLTVSHYSHHKYPSKSLSDDVATVLDILANKKRNTVIVGGCSATTEGVIRDVVQKFERGQAPGELGCAQLISLPLLSLRNASKVEVEKKLLELSCLVKSYVGRGIVLYLGDLKWVAEFWATHGADQQKRNYYSVVEHIIMEIKRLVFEIGEIGEIGRFWVLGTANSQTYMRCKAGYPSLEKMWRLHPFAMAGSSSLSLNLDSDSPSQLQRDGLNLPLRLEIRGSADQIVHKEELGAAVATNKPSLPSWLQQYKEAEESRANSTLHDNQDPCQKWNPYGKRKQTPHLKNEFHFSCSPSPSSISESSQEKNPSLHQSNIDLTWPALVLEPKIQFPKESQFWVSEISDDDDDETFEGSRLRSKNINPIPDLLSNPNSSPNSASSSEAEDEEEEDDPHSENRFNEFTNENLKILIDALESKVPWQREIIPQIARAILECRSASSSNHQNKNKLKRRRGEDDINENEASWLLFLGADYNQGKEKIAREIAKVVFGSYNHFTNLSSKQGCCCYIERLGLSLNENPHRVFFIDYLELLQVNKNCHCHKGLKKAIEKGILCPADGEAIPLKDSIIIFSCDSLDSLTSTVSCSQGKRKKTVEDDTEEKLPLDLNIAIEDEDEDDDHDSVGDLRNAIESMGKQIIFKIQV